MSQESVVLCCDCCFPLTFSNTACFVKLDIEKSRFVSSLFYFIWNTLLIIKPVGFTLKCTDFRYSLFPNVTGCFQKEIMLVVCDVIAGAWPCVTILTFEDLLYRPLSDLQGPIRIQPYKLILLHGKIFLKLKHFCFRKMLQFLNVKINILKKKRGDFQILLWSVVSIPILFSFTFCGCVLADNKFCFQFCQFNSTGN